MDQQEQLRALSDRMDQRLEISRGLVQSIADDPTDSTAFTQLSIAVVRLESLIRGIEDALAVVAPE